jgi:hypothetical protein
VSYHQPLGRAPACRLTEEKGIKVVIARNLLSSESTGLPRAVRIFRRNMPCPHHIGMIGFLTVPRAKLMDK